MSHSASSVTAKDAVKIASASPVSISRNAKRMLWLMVGLGTGIFLSGIFSEDPDVIKRTWMALHVNFTYWLIITAAMTGFSSVLTICNAQWSRPIRRVFESASRFYILLIIPLYALYLGSDKHQLFQWISHDIAGRGSWLNPNFVYLRDIAGLLFLALLSNKIVRLGIARDIFAIRGGLVDVPKEDAGHWFYKEHDGILKGLGTDPKEGIKKASAKMMRLSPVVVIFYALIISFLAFDQIMSVDPHWYSTLFGGFVFMSGVYVAMAWTAILVGVLREIHPLFKEKVERRTLHDLGKLMFGFGIFWAYLFWSHYLPIWYGNIPEETQWVILRLRLEPWHSFAWVVLGMCFFIPFLLGLSRDVKQVPILLALTAMIVAFGIWLQQYLLFTPTLYPETIPLSLIDVSVAAGFIGAFLLTVFEFLGKYPLMPFGDLLVEDQDY